MAGRCWRDAEDRLRATLDPRIGIVRACYEVLHVPCSSTKKRKRKKKYLKGSDWRRWTAASRCNVATLVRHACGGGPRFLRRAPVQQDNFIGAHSGLGLLSGGASSRAERGRKHLRAARNACSRFDLRKVQGAALRLHPFDISLVSLLNALLSCAPGTSWMGGATDALATTRTSLARRRVILDATSSCRPRFHPSLVHVKRAAAVCPNE